MLTRRGLFGALAMSGFNNTVLGGASTLIRKAIRSPNFITGSAGWSINKDGSAEFNNVVIRGGQVISGTDLYYSGAPALGNLVASISASSGTDSKGNAYLDGFSSYGTNAGLSYAVQTGQLGGAGALTFWTATSAAGPWTIRNSITQQGTDTLLIGSTAGINIGPAPIISSLNGAISTSPLAPASLSALSTGSVANSTAETVIGTFTIPANDPVVGSGYRFRIFGSADDTLTPALTLRLRVNGVAGSQVSNGPPAFTCRSSTAGMTWGIDGWLYFTTVGASAIAQGQFIVNDVLSSGTPALHSQPTFSGAPAAFSTLAQWTLVVTAQWGTASASNIARTLAGSLERVCH